MSFPKACLWSSLLKTSLFMAPSVPVRPLYLTHRCDKFKSGIGARRARRCRLASNSGAAPGYGFVGRFLARAAFVFLFEKPRLTRPLTMAAILPSRPHACKNK